MGIKKGTKLTDNPKEYILRVSPRTGRPKIDNPKSISLKIRIDADTHRALLQYRKDNKLTKAAAVRQGIALILGKKK